MNYRKVFLIRADHIRADVTLQKRFFIKTINTRVRYILNQNYSINTYRYFAIAISDIVDRDAKVGFFIPTCPSGIYPAETTYNLKRDSRSPVAGRHTKDKLTSHSVETWLLFGHYRRSDIT